MQLIPAARNSNLRNKAYKAKLATSIKRVTSATKKKDSIDNLNDAIKMIDKQAHISDLTDKVKQMLTSSDN